MNQKEQLIAEAYATRLVEDMDLDTVVELAREYLEKQFLTFTAEELKGDIKDYGMYDDLLEQFDEKEE